jgi:hypothetical protein
VQAHARRLKTDDLFRHDAKTSPDPNCRPAL